MIVVTVLLGVVIGGVLGALGGGGAILTVPALVYVVGQSAQEATTGSLVIVGITAATGVLGHARSGHIRWRTGIAFGVAGSAAAFASSELNRRTNADVLLLCFSAVMLLAATAMLLRSRQPTADAAHDSQASAPDSAPGSGGGGSLRTAHQTTTTVAGSLTTALLVRIVPAGLVVGFLTGLFGVGGGFVIVPALVLVLRMEMPLAVGTSLLIIVINSAASLAARSGQAHFDWTVIVPFTVGAMVGTLVGKRVSDRLPASTLTRAFAVLLIFVAGYVAVRSASALG